MAGSAQGLIEYALLLVYDGDATRPVVDEIQRPTALEEDCRGDVGIAVLCDELIALEGRPRSESGAREIEGRGSRGVAPLEYFGL